MPGPISMNTFRGNQSICQNAGHTSLGSQEKRNFQVLFVVSCPSISYRLRSLAVHAACQTVSGQNITHSTQITDRPFQCLPTPPKKNGRMDLFGAVATGGNWICCWRWSYGQDAPRSKGLNLPLLEQSAGVNVSQNSHRQIIIFVLLKPQQKGQNHQEIAHRLYCTI